jgi:hypothetical protein
MTQLSLYQMGRYLRFVKPRYGLFIPSTSAPFLAPRRLRWPLRQKQLDELHRTASLCFVLQKALPPSGDFLYCKGPGEVWTRAYIRLAFALSVSSSRRRFSSSTGARAYFAGQ